VWIPPDLNFKGAFLELDLDSLMGPIAGVLIVLMASIFFVTAFKDATKSDRPPKKAKRRNREVE
jgi:hypothetical protein